MTASRAARAPGAPFTRGPARVNGPVVFASFPFFLLVALFFAVPVVGMALVAFQVVEEGESSLGLGNFQDSLTGTNFTAIANSVKVSLVSATVAAILGGALAFLISQLNSRALDAAVPVISSVLADSGGIMLAFSFIVMLGNTGVITGLLGLGELGFTLYSWQGLVIMYQYFLVPTMVLVTLPAFKGIKDSWIQASQALGGGRVRFWLRVGIPVALPSIVGAWVLLIGAAFATYASPAVLLSTGGFPLVPLTISNQLSGGAASGREGTAMALGLLMVLVAVVTLFASTKLQQRGTRWVAR